MYTDKLFAGDTPFPLDSNAPFGQLDDAYR